MEGVVDSRFNNSRDPPTFVWVNIALPISYYLHMSKLQGPVVHSSAPCIHSFHFLGQVPPTKRHDDS